MLSSKIFWYIRAKCYYIFGMKTGSKCLLGKPLFTLGLHRVKLYNYVRIFPQSRIEVHNNGNIIIEDNVSIGQNFHIISSEQKLIIGMNTIISGNVFISNCEHEFINNTLISFDTQIGNNCFIGYGAVILPGSKLGKNCIVGANALVKGDFPDNSVIAGVPAKIIKIID
ncbi:TPA: acyltransferase [Photobacterium damselae]